MMYGDKKKRLIKAILSFMMGTGAFILLWVYYDWRLPVFLFFFCWANNISVMIAIKQEKEREDRELFKQTDEMVRSWKESQTTVE